MLLFPPFRLDPTNACLWRGTKRLALPPKDFSVLHYLVAHAGQLVTSEELLHAVWPDTIVSPKGLKAFIRRLRQVLGDTAAKPRFIETVQRRGYRFLPTVTAHPVFSGQFSVASSDKAEKKSSQLTTDNWQLTTHLVGRDAELAQLHGWLDKAASGQRQIVLVTGEPGIGKTALVETFLQSLEPNVQSLASREQEGRQSSKGTRKKLEKARNWGLGTSSTSPQAPSLKPLASEVRAAWGQCIEQYGAGEPYLPVLEALRRLSRTPEEGRLKRVLSQHAPTWLAQLPTLLTAPEQEALQLRVVGTTRERMLREIAEALEVLTAERTLVLVIEDLHWADVSTLELLALLARRRERARLLVLGTYRPLEVLGNGHPLNRVTHELYAHGLCGELALRLLNEEDVAIYLQERFPRSVFPTRLAEVLHRRTEGNPLFVVSVIDELVRQGLMAPTDEGWLFQGDVEQLRTEVPESIRHLVARQREQLPRAEQQILEAASIAGMEFSAAAVAAALETDVIVVGEHCQWLAERQQFLRPAGIAEWPDGTVAARYGFAHALYQHLWHERVSVEKQQQWHLRIGARKEAAYGSRASEIAPELAVHFEQGREYPRVIRYLQQAGENALRRSAYTEAIAHLTRGLQLLQTLPNTPERIQQELGLQVALSAPLTATKGLAAAEVGATHNRARELCQQVGEPPELFPVLWGLCMFYSARAELETAWRLVEQLLRLAQRAQDPALLLQAHFALGAIMFHRGEFVPTRMHLEQVYCYGPQQYRSHTFRYGIAPEVYCRSLAARVLWYLGYPDQALQSSREALTLARKLGHPSSLGLALNNAAYLHWYRREASLMQERAEEAMTLAAECGIAPVLAAGTILRGRARAGEGRGEEGIVQICEGLTACRVIGFELERLHGLALLAEAYGKAGQNEEGLSVLTEALAQVNRTGGRWYEAELYRLKGELTLQRGSRERI